MPRDDLLSAVSLPCVELVTAEPVTLHCAHLCADSGRFRSPHEATGSYKQRLQKRARVDRAMGRVGH